MCTVAVSVCTSFVICCNVSRFVHMCTWMYTDKQNDGLQYTWWRVAPTWIVCVRMCAFTRTAVGRRSPAKKSLSFPHSQGAASHTSVRLLLYTLSWNLRSTNNSPGRPKKRNARGTHTGATLPCPLQMRLPSSFVLAPFRGNSFADVNRVREN